MLGFVPQEQEAVTAPVSEDASAAARLPPPSSPKLRQPSAFADCVGWTVTVELVRRGLSFTGVVVSCSSPVRAGGDLSEGHHVVEWRRGGGGTRVKRTKLNLFMQEENSVGWLSPPPVEPVTTPTNTVAAGSRMPAYTKKYKKTRVADDTVASDVSEVLQLPGGQGLSAREIALVIQARGWRSWATLMQAEKEVARALALCGRTLGGRRQQHIRLNAALAVAPAAAAGAADFPAAMTTATEPTESRGEGASTTTWKTSLHLFQAAIRGEVEDSVQARLEHPGVSASAREPRHGMTLLHKAAQLGDVPLTQLLLDRGVDAEVADNRCGDTPMHYVAWTGPAGGADVVCLLAAAGHRVDCRNAEGKTPLHHALRRGHVNIARHLVKLGAEESLVDMTVVAPPRYDDARMGGKERSLVGVASHFGPHAVGWVIQLHNKNENKIQNQKLNANKKFPGEWRTALVERFDADTGEHVVRRTELAGENGRAEKEGEPTERVVLSAEHVRWIEFSGDKDRKDSLAEEALAMGVAAVGEEVDDEIFGANNAPPPSPLPLLPPRTLHPDAWLQCDDCAKWRRVPKSLSLLFHKGNRWTCPISPHVAFAACERPQEFHDDEIDRLVAADGRGDGRDGDGVDGGVVVVVVAEVHPATPPPATKKRRTTRSE